MNIKALSGDDRLLAIHISDLVKLSQKRCAPCFTDFLNEMQTAIAVEVMEQECFGDYMFWGGYENADRVMLCVYPPYMCPEKEEFPFECLNLKYPSSRQLSHRDFLGSLMSLGLKREVVGDIVVDRGLTSFFVKSELSAYVKAQITKIGRVGVSFAEERVDLDKISRQYEQRICTVSSLRLDSVISAAANLSRGKSKQLIQSGLAAKNFKVIYDPDCKLQDGDKISIRGYGKFVLNFDGSVSKKGKYRIIVNKLK